MHSQRIRNIREALEHASLHVVAPPGIGTSTLLRSSFPAAPVVDLADKETFFRFALSAKVPAAPVSIVESIHLMPSLLDQVETLDRPGRRFLLTGKITRRLQHFRYTTLPPPTFPELQPTDLATILATGCLPGAQVEPEPDSFLRAAAGQFLSQATSPRQVAALAKVLRQTAERTGQEANIAELARVSQLPPRTTFNYVKLLVDTGILFSVEAFQGNRRKTSTSPRYYYFDQAIARVVRGDSPPNPGGKAWDRAFREWIVQECRAAAGALKFWQTRTGTDVDLILPGGTALAIRSSTAVSPSDLRGLRAITTETTWKHRILVCQEPVERSIDGIEVLPWRSFLERLWDGQYTESHG